MRRPASETAPARPVRRKSSMRIPKYVATLLVSGFLYRPILFFADSGIVARWRIFAWLCVIWIGGRDDPVSRRNEPPVGSATPVPFAHRVF